jgi:flagellar biogenesis protein FliO
LKINKKNIKQKLVVGLKRVTVDVLKHFMIDAIQENLEKHNRNKRKAK